MNTNGKKLLDKHTWLVMSLAALLCVAAYLNYSIGGSSLGSDLAVNSGSVDLSSSGNVAADTTLARDVASSALKPATGSYASYKTARQTAEQTELKALGDTIANKKTDAATLKQAQQRKLELTQAMSQETTIEGLLAGIGFKDTLVTVSSGAVNVVVKGGTLTDAQVAQILEIVTKQTSVDPINVKVIPAQ